MKRLFCLLFILLAFLFAGCSAQDSSDTSADSASDASSESAVISSPETAFDLGLYGTDTGLEYYYFDTTADELLTTINAAVTEAGYQPYALADSTIAEDDHKRDVYAYRSPDSTYTLTIRVLHGNQKIYTVALSLSLSEENLAREQFMMETLADSFAPGKGQEVCETLEVYTMTKEDEYGTRSEQVGNTVFSVTVPYSFNINTSEY